MNLQKDYLKKEFLQVSQGILAQAVEVRIVKVVPAVKQEIV